MIAEPLDIDISVVSTLGVLVATILIWAATFLWHFIPFRALLKGVGKIEYLAGIAAFYYATVAAAWAAAAMFKDPFTQVRHELFLFSLMTAWVLFSIVPVLFAFEKLKIKYFGQKIFRTYGVVAYSCGFLSIPYFGILFLAIFICVFYIREFIKNMIIQCIRHVMKK
jgi:hypothetical protein